MPYSNIFGGSPILPADVSYKRIELQDDLRLVWTNSFSDSDSAVAQIMEVEPQVAGKSILLPDATLVSVGTAFLILNVGAQSFYLLDFSSNLLSRVNSGNNFYIYLNDNQSQNGAWRAIPIGAGGGQLPGITIVGADAIGNGLTVTGSPITAPGGTISFQLSDILQNLSNFQGRALSGLTVFNSTTNQFSTKPLVAGDGITIDNPRGEDGDPTISVRPGAGGAITTINMNAPSRAVEITGSPQTGPTATFGVGVHQSLRSLYTMAATDPIANSGIVVKNSGSREFSLSPSSDFMKSLSITTPQPNVADSNVFNIYGSPTSGSNPTIKISPNVNLTAICNPIFYVAHPQFPAAMGVYKDGVFTNAYNILSIETVNTNQVEIKVDLPDYYGNPFCCFQMNQFRNWRVLSSGKMNDPFVIEFEGNTAPPGFYIMVFGIRKLSRPPTVNFPKEENPENISDEDQ